MSVKVILKDDVVKSIQFPKLMIDDEDLVVLFDEYQEGFVVQAKSGYNLCYYSNSWDMSDFTDYKGIVTLENE
tara:strand:- start:260 stop:478 length:219 start_codon:yes stop_codon:yes gene_type:complete